MMQAGRATGCPVRCDLPGDGCQEATGLRRLALQAGGEQEGVEACLLRRLESCLRRLVIVPDHLVLCGGKEGVAGLGRLGQRAADAALQALQDGGRGFFQQVVARQHVPGVLVGGGVGAGRSGGDNIQGIADDVGEDEGGGTGGVRQAG